MAHLFVIHRKRFDALNNSSWKNPRWWRLVRIGGVEKGILLADNGLLQFIVFAWSGYDV